MLSCSRHSGLRTIACQGEYNLTTVRSCSKYVHDMNDSLNVFMMTYCCEYNLTTVRSSSKYILR